MRRSSLLLAFTVFSTLALNPALCPTPAAAQQVSATQNPLPCTESVNMIRVSDVKPGMMEKFLQAVAAQKSWYRNAGMPDQIGVMRIMIQDPATKAYSMSETAAITTHLVPAGGAKAPAHDAAWDAFVAMFNDSSTIKTAYLTCTTAL